MKKLYLPRATAWRCTFRLAAGVGVRSSSTSQPFAQNLKPFSAIPGPCPTLSESLIASVRLCRGGKHHWIPQLIREYGPVTKVNVIGEPFVVVSDPNAIEEVFRNEGHWPCRGRYEEALKEIHCKIELPDGLVLSTGANWKKLRSAMSRQVVPKRLANYSSGLSSISKDLCDHFASQRDANGWMNDIFDAMGKWSLKGVSYVVFDEQIDVFSGEDAKAAALVKASQEFVEAVGLASGVLLFYRNIPTWTKDIYVTKVQNIRKLGRDFMKRRYDQLSEDCQQGTLGVTSTVGLLEQWLLEGKMTEEEAISQACDQLAAGVDTTSSTATFLLHELAKQPDLQVEVRQEIMDVLGSTSQPSFDQLQEMKLVRACVRETLRLYPAIATTFRIITSDINISGYHIPAGTTVHTDIFSSSRDTRYFTTPEKFVPSRWLHEKETIHPFSSISFGFGPRMCYGRRIAELELYLLLVQVLQRFNLSTDQTEIKELTQRTALRPNEPVRMRFTDN